VSRLDVRGTSFATNVSRSLSRAPVHTAGRDPTTGGRLAISKDGKPLAGAAKTAIVNKCKKDSCEPKAVSSDGKFMKKCQNDA
jgi:hypothetical protein